MLKDDFINSVTEKLSKIGFNKIEDCWTRKIVQQSSITINGQPFGNNIESDLKVSIFADAKIDNSDAAQMLFEFITNNDILWQYEEVIRYDDVDIIETLCHQLFRI